MKKLLVVLLALTVLGIFAYADDAAAAPAAPVVSIGDFGRQVFVFGNQDNGNGYYAGTQASWGGTPRIVGLNITAHNDNAGFAISPDADSGFGLTDENKAWVSPLPGLTFESGIQLETDTWRGSSDFGSDDWLRFPGVAVDGNSSTFARLGEGGYMTDLNYNKDGIGAWAAFQGGNGADITYDFGDSIQAGAAYAIAGIGMIKAQYLGMNVNGHTLLGQQHAPDIQAAFNLSAVKGLYEEIGAVIPTVDEGYSFAFADDTDYTAGALTIHARVDVVSYDNKVANNAMGLAAGVGLDYDLGNGLDAGADFQYVNQAQENQGNGSGPTSGLTGIAVDIKKGFSNGLIGIGFEYSSLGFAGAPVTNAYSHWAIPIVASEWF